MQRLEPLACEGFVSCFSGYRTPKATLICDYIGKHVNNVDGLLVQPFPGATIGSITARIQRGQASIAFDYTILHIGTNDVERKSVPEMAAEYSNLLTVIREISETQVVISGILPRPVDFNTLGRHVLEINQGLSTLCFCRGIKFLKTYRSFLFKGIPRRELFAVNDGGLHLNFEGTRRFRQSLISFLHSLGT